jgi:hypothetical protein
MAHEVVDVPRDTTPLGKQRLPGKLPPRRLELGSELSLANEGTTERPRKSDAQHPDGNVDLGRILDQGDSDG